MKESYHELTRNSSSLIIKIGQRCQCRTVCIYHGFQCEHEFAIHQKFKHELFNNCWFILDKLGREKGCPIIKESVISKKENTNSILQHVPHPNYEHSPHETCESPLHDVNHPNYEDTPEQPCEISLKNHTLSASKNNHKQNYHYLKQISSEIIEAVSSDESATKVMMGMFSVLLNKVRSNGLSDLNSNEAFSSFTQEFNIGHLHKNIMKLSVGNHYHEQLIINVKIQEVID